MVFAHPVAPDPGHVAARGLGHRVGRVGQVDHRVPVDCAGGEVSFLRLGIRRLEVVDLAAAPVDLTN